MPQLEIAADTLADALEAQRGGAHSIELARDLSLGGLTPDLDLAARVRNAITIDLHVMIRSHARDFRYTAAEMDAMLADAERLRAIGVTGIVFGAQEDRGRLHIPHIETMCTAAGDLAFTLHRAIDTAIDPADSLRALAGIVTRVLTSGPAATAWEGRASLQAWVAAFPRVGFVVSGAITLDQLPILLTETGAHEAHIGGAARVDGAVSADRVRALLAASQIEGTHSTI